METPPARSRASPDPMQRTLTIPRKKEATNKTKAKNHTTNINTTSTNNTQSASSSGSTHTSSNLNSATSPSVSVSSPSVSATSPSVSVPSPSGLSRSASRSKGISLNLAVSPVAGVPKSTRHKRSVSAVPVQQPLSQVNEHPDLKYDLPLPPTDRLVEMDIDEQLRLLALKEMCIVEIKDSIANLTSKLGQHEHELHKLREVIQKSLYRELNGETAPRTRHQRQDSNPREEAIASTKNRSRRRTLSASYHQPVEVEKDKRNSKLWSNLAKPLNMLQHFDTMLQNEFEKSLSTPVYSTEQSSVNSQYESRHSEDSLSSFGSQPSPLKSKSTLVRSDVPTITLEKEYNHENTPKTSEDMLQTVSSSIWTFVNDVKSNVLSSLSEEEARPKPVLGQSSSNVTTSPMYNLETGSTINVNEDDEDPNTVVYHEGVVVNSDYEDTEAIDFSMYSDMRDK